MKKKSKFKLLLKLAGWSFAAVVLFVITCNILVIQQTKKMLYSDTTFLPHNNVGLVLGTSKRMADGSPNLFFKHRINAAVLLFASGKINHILVSGDNSTIHYNEAMDMKKALMEQGIPDSCITLDYAGFRTLDSVVRCKKVFGQNSFTIISQEFHNERALFICKNYDIVAIGFNAEDVPVIASLSTLVREWFAKTKAVIDVYLLHDEPKFLGDPVEIKI